MILANSKCHLALVTRVGQGAIAVLRCLKVWHEFSPRFTPMNCWQHVVSHDIGARPMAQAVYPFRYALEPANPPASFWWPGAKAEGPKPKGLSESGYPRPPGKPPEGMVV